MKRFALSYKILFVTLVLALLAMVAQMFAYTAAYPKEVKQRFGQTTNQ